MDILSHPIPQSRSFCAITAAIGWPLDGPSPSVAFKGSTLPSAKPLLSSAISKHQQLNSKNIADKISTERAAAMLRGDTPPLTALPLLSSIAARRSWFGCQVIRRHADNPVIKFAARLRRSGIASAMLRRMVYRESQRTALERAVSMFFIRKGGNQNDWDATPLGS